MKNYWEKKHSRNKMARPTPLLSSGDLVYSENCLCYIESIDNTLGWNIYHLVDFDSGRKLQKARHELTLPDITLMDDTFETEADGTEEIQQNEANKKEKGSKRFAEIGESDLDELAINRNSKRTRNQTTWAVSIFKGETPYKQRRHFEFFGNRSQ
jgi:hypothetical protein